jgi:hypothetical protein
MEISMMTGNTENFNKLYVSKRLILDMIFVFRDRHTENDAPSEEAILPPGLFHSKW